MFKTENNEIYVTRGDSGTLEIKMEKDDGEEYDFSNDRVVFSVKRKPCDFNPLIQKEAVDGKVKIEPDDTKNLPFGTFFYDVVLYIGEGTNTETIATVITPTAFIVGEEVHT